MNERVLISTVLRFNEMINTRDLTGLSEMLHEDHVFIDASGERHEGRKEMILGWEEFFRKYPDYRNNFTHVITKDGLVVMLGFSDCSFESLDGPAIWTANVKDSLITQWRVYDDSRENRSHLGLV